MSMKYVVVLFALLFLPQHSQSVTIAVLRQRISQMQQFIDSQSSKLQSNITTNILNTQKFLNNTANILQQQISKGPIKCRPFISDVKLVRIEDIFGASAFQSCQMAVEMEKLKGTNGQLEDMSQTLGHLQITFTFCLGQIRNANGGVKTIKKTVDVQITGIDQGSNTCIATQRKKVIASLNVILKAWRNCTKSA